MFNKNDIVFIDFENDKYGGCLGIVEIASETKLFVYIKMPKAMKGSLNASIQTFIKVSQCKVIGNIPDIFRYKN